MDSGTPRIAYRTIPGADVTDLELTRSSELFSGHYGVWSDKNPFKLTAGSPVRMSGQKMRQQLLFDEQTCELIQAESAGQLVGHAFVCRFNVSDKGLVSWITQLVVHSNFRKLGVGSKLCHIAWGVRNYFASGLVTSHPYAVRALEAATERKCDRTLIMQHANDLINHGNIPYVQNRSLHFEGGKCLIDTQFYVDHTEVEALLSGIPNWHLGNLEDGKEFFAFTFAETPKSSPNPSPSKYSKSG